MVKLDQPRGTLLAGHDHGPDAVERLGVRFQQQLVLTGNGVEVRGPVPVHDPGDAPRIVDLVIGGQDEGATGQQGRVDPGADRIEGQGRQREIPVDVAAHGGSQPGRCRGRQLPMLDDDTLRGACCPAGVDHVGGVVWAVDGHREVRRLWFGGCLVRGEVGDGIRYPVGVGAPAEDRGCGAVRQQVAQARRRKVGRDRHVGGAGCQDGQHVHHRTAAAPAEHGDMVARADAEISEPVTPSRHLGAQCRIVDLFVATADRFALHAAGDDVQGFDDRGEAFDELLAALPSGQPFVFGGQQDLQRGQLLLRVAREQQLRRGEPVGEFAQAVVGEDVGRPDGRETSRCGDFDL